MTDKDQYPTTVSEVANFSTNNDKEQYVTDVTEVDSSVLAWMAEQLQIPSSDDDGSYSPEVHFMAARFEEMNFEDACKLVRENMKYHDNDNNFRDEYRREIRDLMEALDSVGGGDDEKMSLDDPNNKVMMVRYWATIFHWWSPYPEVRAVTDPQDDTECTSETWRVWVLGTIWVGIAAFINQFFSPRMPSIGLGAGVIQLLLFPCGRFLEYVLPDKGFTFRGTRYSLNPGRWSQKEQLLTTIMVSCASGTPYITYNLMTQILPSFYGQEWARSFSFGFVFMLSTQMMGFGLAGLLKRCAVYPVKAVWPSLLPTLAVNKALLAPNRKETINGWTITKYKFFLILVACSFAYFWLPNYLFEALSYTNWMTWIAPENETLARVTGSLQGMGYNPIPTFDWNMATAAYSPVAMPLYTVLNDYIAVFISGLVILGLYYTNNFWTSYIPINTNRLYDNQGKPYQVMKILTNNRFDDEKYQAYSPPFYGAANLVVYSSFFAIYPLSFVYVTLMEWAATKEALVETAKALRHIHRSNYEGRVDPFSRYMRKYKEVPDWWFYIIMVLMFVLSVVMVQVWPVDTPVWTLVFVIGLVLAFIIPFTIFAAYTANSLSLNVISELIIGYALPGSFMALNHIKALSVTIQMQAQNYASDQKLTHYAHLPPRSIFWMQIWATFVNGLVCLGVLSFQVDMPDICEPTNKYKFTCPGDTTFFTASVAWGVIGPKKMFDKYPAMKWMFLLGALLGVLFYLLQVTLPAFLAKKYPSKEKTIDKIRRQLLYINPIIVCGGFMAWAPYNLSYRTGGLYLALLFNMYIKSRYLAWWKKYAYILEAGMGTGIAICAIIIFFAVQYNPVIVDWWGNNVPYVGVDGTGLSIIEPIPDVGYFGPAPGNYD